MDPASVAPRATTAPTPGGTGVLADRPAALLSAAEARLLRANHVHPGSPDAPASAAPLATPEVGSGVFGAEIPAATTEAAATEAVDAARCPIPGVSKVAASCPVGFGPSPSGVRRSPADHFVRRLLRIKERPAGVSDAQAYRLFQRSMGISAIRCTLTYVVFPFVLPAAGFAKGVGPVFGLIIGLIALTCDVFTIRRFFAVDHKYRWHFSAIALCVMGLLTYLLVEDIVHIVQHLTS